MNTKVVVVSGSMGSGKTTVLGESSDILTAHGIAHATVDLDAIGTALLPGETAAEITYRSLAALYATFTSAGITRLLIAEAVETRHALERLRHAMPGAEVIVGRLRAAIDTMEARLRVRETGMLQAQFLARVSELERVLNAAAVEDFSVLNDHRSVTDVARELLQRAGWIPN